jgi:hypothetical protein
MNKYLNEFKMRKYVGAKTLGRRDFAMIEVVKRFGRSDFVHSRIKRRLSKSSQIAAATVHFRVFAPN